MFLMPRRFRNAVVAAVFATLTASGVAPASSPSPDTWAEMLSVRLFRRLDGSEDPRLAALEKELKTAYTQGDMTAIAAGVAEYWDDNLNRIYRQAIVQWKGSPRQEALRRAQRAWLAFRNAELSIYYADEACCGSITSLELALHAATLSRERCMTLREWLKE